MFPLAIPSTPYNLANASNVTDFAGYLRFANELSGYTFGWLIVVAIFIISYMISSGKTNMADAFIVASVGGFMSSLLLSMIGMVDPAVVVIMLFMLAVGVGWGVVKKE